MLGLDAKTDSRKSGRWAEKGNSPKETVRCNYPTEHMSGEKEIVQDSL